MRKVSKGLNQADATHPVRSGTRRCPSALVLPAQGSTSFLPHTGG